MSTSIFGMMYDAIALAFVMKPGSLWQYVFWAVLDAMLRLPSGSAARTSQLSVTVVPLLMPPWNVRPLLARALKLIRKPL